MRDTQHSVLESFGRSSIGRQKGTPKRLRTSNPTEMFGSGETFQFASIDVANAEIRKRLRGYIQPDPVGDLKSYVEGSYVTDADLCVAEGHALFDLFQPSLDSPFSEEMEGAIENSRKMLDLSLIHI